MDTQKSKLNEIGKTNPFKVPDGYFERFSEDLMSKLPEHTVVEPKVTLWKKLRPWSYAAAVCIGAMLMFKIFSGSPEENNIAQNKTEKRIDVSSEHEVDDFYTYYEDQAAINAYRETLYSEASFTEEDTNHKK